MARTTISLPDELVAKLRGEDDLNVSAICRTALEEELARRVQLDGMAENAHEIEIDMLNGRGTVVDVVRFRGRKLAEFVEKRQDPFETTATHVSYLTGRGRFAFVRHNPGHDLFGTGSPSKLEHFDTLDEARNAGIPLKLIAETSKSLGQNIARRLDI